MNSTFKGFNGCFVKKQPFLFYLLLLLTVSQCTKTELPKDDQILLTVNDYEVTVFDFESGYVEYLISNGRNDTKEQRNAYVNQLIDRILIAEEAAKQGYLDHELYNKAVKREQMRSMMDFYFMDKMEEVLEPPTDEEVRLAFAKTKRTVYVSHLFSMKESELTEPYQRLKSGEPFLQVANDFYETAEFDSSAGYLGPIKYFSVDDAFAETAFSLNMGEFSPPVKSRFGYHIVFVNFIEFPAMLAEDEYQYRKTGVFSQVRLRNQELKADKYIRDLMGSLDVEVEPDAVIELRNIILELNPEAPVNTTATTEMDNPRWTDDRLQELRAAFNNETVLATFVLDGERQQFTFDDYLNWLPDLSFEESKVRTGASIGRALRNEVLFQLAANTGYQNDERVQKEMKERGYKVLSRLYEFDQAKEAVKDTTEINIPSAFRDRIIRQREYELIATYWKIDAESLADARLIRKEIIEKGIPESYDSYELFEELNVQPQEFDYTLVRDGLLNTPSVAHNAEDGWIVMDILDRSIQDVTKDTKADELQWRYKIYQNLNNQVEEFREKANIELDTALFEEIYNIYQKQRDEAETE